jgi:hypothetical protein
VAAASAAREDGLRRLTVPLRCANKDGQQGVLIGDLIAATDNAGVDATGDKFTSVTVDLRRADLCRWKLAYEYNASRRLTVDGPDVLFDRIKNFPMADDAFENIPFFVGATIAGFAYGGLHCLAWNAPFTTESQRILWRLSSITVMSTGVLILFLVRGVLLFGGPVVLSDYINIAQTSVDSWLCTQSRLGEASKWVRRGISALVFQPLKCGLVSLTITSILLFLGYIILYFLARVYLVVECFISLSHLPASVFQVPVWSQYVPHIS